MDYLFKRPNNEVIVPIPATIITEEKKDSHITFISREEYLRDIEMMCQRDKWFMETIRGFCDKEVEVNVESVAARERVGAECSTQCAPKRGVEQPIQSDKSTSISGEGSK